MEHEPEPVERPFGGGQAVGIDRAHACLMAGCRCDNQVSVPVYLTQIKASWFRARAGFAPRIEQEDVQMSLSILQPPGIFETGGNHVKPFLTAMAIFAAAVIVSLLIAGLP